MKYDLSVTFQVIDDTRAKAFVNEEFVGNVRIHSVKCGDTSALRLTFRNSRDPGKRFVPMSSCSFDLSQSTVATELELRGVREKIIPIVICAFLRTTRFLSPEDHLRLVA